jgi:hypothetical protein
MWGEEKEQQPYYLATPLLTSLTRVVARARRLARPRAPFAGRPHALGWHPCCHVHREAGLVPTPGSRPGPVHHLLGGHIPSWHLAATRVEMTMRFTRNPSTRRVLPNKETGMELYFYPRVHKWVTSCTHQVSGCGCGHILPTPAYRG